MRQVRRAADIVLATEAVARNAGGCHTQTKPPVRFLVPSTLAKYPVSAPNNPNTLRFGVSLSALGSDRLPHTLRGWARKRRFRRHRSPPSSERRLPSRHKAAEASARKVTAIVLVYPTGDGNEEKASSNVNDPESDGETEEA